LRLHGELLIDKVKDNVHMADSKLLLAMVQ